MISLRPSTFIWQNIQIFQIGYSQTISSEKLNTGQYFEKRKWSQDDMLNLHKMFTDKDSIQDFHDGNDYLQASFQIDSALSLVHYPALWLVRINLKTYQFFDDYTL